MKILVVFTGGTIGSVVEEGYISPDSRKPFKLMECYHEQKAGPIQGITFDTCVPYTLLSENLTGEYLAKLGACVRENLRKDYDGIIVAHGTDTLQYAAAMVGYLTGSASIPVMFVSSNYVLEDERANGLDNFACAVEFITERRGRGTFVSYRNQDNVVYIHRAARVLPHLPYSDEVYSIGDQYYGKYVKNASQPGLLEKGIPETGEWIYKENVEYHFLEDADFSFEQLPRQWNSGILRIFPYPGMEYSVIFEHVRAVMLETYHSGTLCSITPGIWTFLESAKQQKVPVYVTGVNTEADYASFQGFERNGKVLRNLSPVAAYVKLWLALESGEDVARVMEMNLAEDFFTLHNL
ncbi:MAG: asparaginase domain-containing protein [Lachnospiraceae bacterium]|nr:asparaginase domain-containing protein [Lachnospiraceae bacterium]